MNAAEETAAEARTVPVLQARVLRFIAKRLEDSAVDWVVTGSMGMALQGVPFEVHDIDIQTDHAGAYQVEARLMEFVVTPVRYTVSERIRSHLGELEVEGVRVEIMGGIEKLIEGVSEPPVDVRDHRCWVALNDVRVPVLSLEYECEAYLKLGRAEKAEALRAWLGERVEKGRSVS